MAHEWLGWPQRLLGNFKIKLLALVLAVFVWYIVQSVISFEMEVTEIPVKVLVGENVIVNQLSDNFVDVYFRGTQDDVLKLNRDEVDVVVDLRSHKGEGRVSYHLRAGNIHAPENVRVVYIRPTTISMELVPRPQNGKE